MTTELRVTRDQLYSLCPKPVESSNPFWYAQELPPHVAKLANTLNRMGIQLAVSDTRVGPDGKPWRLPYSINRVVHKFVFINEHGDETVLRNIPADPTQETMFQTFG